MARVTTPDEIPFLQIGSIFPTTDQQHVIDQYKLNEKLFDGKHDELFNMDEYSKLNPNMRKKVDIIVNFPASVTRAYTDLLFGEFPDINVDEQYQEWLEEFIDRNDLHNEFLIGGDAQSMRGVALLQIWKENGKSRMKVISAENWFPVPSEDFLRKFDAHVTGWFEKVIIRNQNGTQAKEIKIFHATIFFTDRIYYYDYTIESGKISMVEERMPSENVADIDDFLLFPVYNLVKDNDWMGISDYADCVNLFGELDRRLSQYSEILDKHADPTLLGDKAFLKNIYLEDGSVHSTYFEKENYMTVQKDQMKPEYLTWDAKLESSDKFIETIMKKLYLVTDTTSALFGQYGSGEIPSGGAFKKLFIRTMARKNRKARQWKVLDKAISICYYLEYGERIKVNTVFKSGLPVDEMEMAQILNMAVSGKQFMSTKRALEFQGLEGDALNLEMLELEAEKEMASGNNNTGEVNPQNIPENVQSGSTDTGRDGNM